jgi:hypothetical protein
MELHAPQAGSPAGPGWHYARPRETGTAEIEIVHVVRNSAGGLEVEIAGTPRTLALAAFDWLGPVVIPSLSVRTGSRLVGASRTAALERDLQELVSAMRAKGYRSPTAAVVLSASGDGIIVGTYLNPDGNQASSMLDTTFTDGTLDWARLQVLRLPGDEEAPISQPGTTDRPAR